MKNNSLLEYLVGSKKITEGSFLPYDNLICTFLGELSNSINSFKNISDFPDLKALAFWIRYKNIISLKKKYSNDQIRLSRGLIFHITPSNIPTNFAYSLIFGLLTGNRNIVKVPSKNFVQITIVCNEINKLLKKRKFTKIQKMITVVKYNNNSEFTKKISLLCNVRMIWGGDNTINEINKFPLKIRSFNIEFSDRYSFCVLDTKAIINADKYRMESLVRNFYNDTYLVDQNACSSPHLIVWFGKNPNVAKSKFWNQLLKLLEKKYYPPEIALIDNLTKFYNDSIINSKNIISQKRFKNLIYTIQLKKLYQDQDSYRGKWGYFYEFHTLNFNQIKNIINTKYQTLTYFGLEKKYFNKFLLDSNLIGIDRVVPIGRSLDMSFYWDGLDLNKTLTRIVDLV